MKNLTEIPTTVDGGKPSRYMSGPEVRVSHQSWKASFWQLVRFGIVGVLNTVLDILALNLLLLGFPTHNANLLLLYNTAAYTFGALNSYVLNKTWTFHHRKATTGGELLRFALVNGVGILCSDGIIWMAARVLHPVITNPVAWANASKLIAVLGTAIITYLGMRLWVFASKPHTFPVEALSGACEAFFNISRPGVRPGHIPFHPSKLIIAPASTFLTYHSLSVVLPAHNEETVIARTIHTVVNTLTVWVPDFEIIVVNDGSKDRTRGIVEAIAATDPRVRLINHPVNQGYGAALVSGFAAVTKDLAFFMDADGQFDIRDLAPFFPFIGEYDAVLGYRMDRQDTWMRKFNAWGWKLLVRTVFGLRVRDVDCAFKLYRANFFREHRLETRGAMINTEILYKFTRAGYTYTQLGVQHLPRRSGQATGAKPAVIARALRELLVYAWKWRVSTRLGPIHRTGPKGT